MSIRKLLLLIFFVPILVFSQSGKIAGVVNDADTGEPLVGVNVILEGTTRGAMTDIEGYYVILNVPVSTFKLRAIYIGYQDVVVENVRVSSSVTTNAHIEMKETTLELDDVVIVRAERPLVEKNVTQSYSLVTSEEIESIPVRGLNNIIALQASVVLQDGNIHIRGGREEEVGYYLDGASTSDVLTNNNAIYVIQDAIEEVQVLTGGYTAEFGGANSGIIRTQLKSGTSDFHATLDFQTDKFASEGDEFLGTTSFQHHIATASVSGSISDKIKFFIAGENFFQGDDEIRFSKGFQFDDLIDSNPERLVAAQANPDTLSLSYPDGFTPRNERDRFAINGAVTFDLNPLSFRVGGSWNTQDVYNDVEPWLNILRNRERYTQFDTYLITAKMTHVISPTSFYEINLGAFSSEDENYDSERGNDWKTWYDSAAVNIPGAYRDAWKSAPNYIFNGIPFRRNGNPINSYNHNKQEYLSAAFNFTSQVNRHHEIKFGGDIRAYVVRSFNIAPSVMRFAADTSYDVGGGVKAAGGIDSVKVNQWISNGDVDAYGYDIYGNEIDSDKNYSSGAYVNGPKEPLFGSFYIQDKMEFDDLIINAGLRVDYFDADDEEFIDPANVQRDSTSRLVLRSSLKDVDAHILVSPRLGFSFPVSDKTVFYFQYGKFAQLPQLNRLYTSVLNLSDKVFGGFADLDPIGNNLDPIKTTSYEIGFRQQISDVAAFDITGFYRNIKGQVQPLRIKSDPLAEHANYNKLVNGDFATTKGLEFKLTLRRTNRLRAQLNYTLTDAQGTGSNTNAYIAALERGTVTPTIVNPLDYSQTHRGSINLDYRFGNNDGGPVLQNFGANMLFTFNSGHPYTRVTGSSQSSFYDVGVDYMNDTRQREALEPINASTTPWNFIVDLRLDKSFNIADKLNATVYLRVNNLFNTKNIINVYQITGTATDDGKISTQDAIESALADANLGQTYLDLYNAINIENGGSYRSELGLELYGQPRQIFFGIRLAY